MKVSLNMVKQYIDFELPPVGELVERINQQLGGVEEVIDLGVRYKDALIVKVVEVNKHPNADRLSVTKVDDGGMCETIERDENGYVQVVCGAPNVQAGMFAVWLPPSSVVPASYDQKELFVLGSRELRGVMSHGMLAAADELAIGSDHEGILEINPDEWKPNDVEIKPGVSFAAAYGLDDIIIDIENKMFTHRPDLFGQLGVAREIAGILGHKFTSPNWYLDVPQLEAGSGLELEAFNDASEKVPRTMFTTMKDIEVGPSPQWLQCALVAMGSKPINNIVDITNYVMLLTAQPTHAYDYDKIRGHKIGARMAEEGEKVDLLNGKSYELTKDDIVIADAEGAVGLAGIMGGGDSEVDADTKNIVLEVATFDMYAVRKSSMRHGVFTDALTRFNKGQSPLQNNRIMSLLIASIKDISSAKPATEVFDICGDIDQNNPVNVSQDFINERLGLKLGADETRALLENVEIEVGEGFSVSPPFWRTDLELPEDIVEEVGRLYGFDKLPRELPRRSIEPALKNNNVVMKQAVREFLSRGGANEVLTYSFVHKNIILRSGQDVSLAYGLSNALSPDLQYYRLSVVPSLLDKIHANIKAGYDEFALFEIGKAHQKNQNDETGLPRELGRIGFVVASKDTKQAPFYKAKYYLSELFASLGVNDVCYEIVNDAVVSDTEQQMIAPFEPLRSAFVKVQGHTFGVVGEFKSSVAADFKLPKAVAGFEIDSDLLEQTTRHLQAISYVPLSRYPSTERDVCFQVNQTVSYQEILDAAKDALKDLELDATMTPVDIYQAEASDSKNVTIRIRLVSHERTLSGDDASAVVNRVVESVVGRTAAVVV